MCLSSHAFGLFLSIINLSNVSVEQGHVTIHTPDKDVHWITAGELWCTVASGGTYAALDAGSIPT